MPIRCPLGRAAVVLALAGCVLAGCSQPPFDASAPWKPTQSTEGRAYSGALQSSVPRGNFAAFEGDGTVPDREDTLPTSVSSQGGENPWATQPRNPVVLICYGSWVNDVEDVRAEAQRLCPADSQLRLEAQDAFWNGCPLLQPNRAAFRCLTGGSDGGA